jgi:hypothetical protein
MLADSHFGRLYVDRNGAVQLEWWQTELGKTSAMTLNYSQTSPWYSSLTVAPGFGMGLTEVRITRPQQTTIKQWGGETIEFESEDYVLGIADSTAQWQSRTLVVDTLLADQTDVEALAATWGVEYAAPVRTVESVTCKPEAWGALDAATIAALEIGTRITVTLPDSSSFIGTVERIDWDFADSVTCRLGLAKWLG